MKTCTKCKVCQPIENYNLQCDRKSGRSSHCKKCEAEYKYEYNLYHPPVRRKLSKNELILQLGAVKRYQCKNPEKIIAKTKLNAAINSGKLIRQSCEICGVDKKIHGHHDDYSKPLDVIWLCVKHHAALHREQNRLRSVA